jgi:hypothetical protein
LEEVELELEEPEVLFVVGADVALPTPEEEGADVALPTPEEEGADVALPEVEFDCENTDDVDTDTTNIVLNIVTVKIIPILIFVLLFFIN